MSGWKGVILCIIIGDAHQFLGYCLIDLNTYLKHRIIDSSPWIFCGLVWLRTGSKPPDINRFRMKNTYP